MRLETIAASKDTIDTSWMADDLQTQLDALEGAEQRALRLCEGAANFIEAMYGLLAFDEPGDYSVVKGRAVTPLDEWRWLPTPQHMRSAVSNADRLVRSARTLRPKLETAIAALRKQHVRAA